MSDAVRQPGSAPAFLAAGGEMGALIRSMDWSKTGLGPIDSWPQSLRTSVSTCLDSRFPILIWWGPDLIKIYNDAYRQIIGEKHPRSMGQRGRECWPEIWPIIGPMLEGVLDRGEATWSENQLLVLERHGYPEECYFTFSYSPIRDEGGIAGVFCAVTETTEQVLGERRLRTLRALAERTAGAGTVERACALAVPTLTEDPHDLPFTLLYLMDEDGRHARLAALSGLERGAFAAPEVVALAGGAPWPFHRAAESGTPIEVAGLERFGSLPGGPWPDSSRRALVLPLAKPGLSRHAGFMVAGLSPRLALTEGYASFLALLAGEVSTAIAGARAHEEERRRADALAELDRAKTRFFTNVSHEFRTPLTLMLGPLEELLGEPETAGSPSTRERLEGIHRQALRLLKLVNTLLDFSSLEAGRASATYRRTDLAALTTELASLFRSAIEKAGLGLIVDCPPVEAPVFVDRDLWEKIVLNLLSNALKFTFEGEIAVRLRRVSDAVELSVQDTGVGIPARDLPHVFERFHRVEGTRRRSHEGTGIGLALVAELAKLHGGSARVESVENQGTTFTVSLPVGSDHLQSDRLDPAPAPSSTGVRAGIYVDEALRWLPGAPATRAPEPGDPGLPGARAAGRIPPRLVLADDHADMRDYVSQLLGARFEVEAVADGRAALEAIRRQRPDLVLADVMMPELDGFGLVAELRADPALRDLPIILLSARAGEEARIEGAAAGADDYLVKPFGARELIARVSALHQVAQLRRATAGALRESEERLRLALDAGRMGTWEWNLATDRVDWSPGLMAIHGLGEGEFEGSFAAFQQDIHPEDRDRVLHAIAGSLERGTDHHIEYRIVWADGSVRWVEGRGKLYRDAAGAPVRMIGICMDVTERKQAEEAVRQSDRRKDEFLATLAHELRNPLAPLRNGLQVMRLASHDAARIEQTRTMMERQLGHMVRLIDDLLDLSRISQGKLTLHPHPVALPVVLQQAVETSRPAIEQAGHELAIHLPPESISVEADPIRLAQVFSNLLNNAAKFTRRGGRIHVAIRRDAGEAVVTVADSGIGIAAEMLPRVFDRFTQVDHSLEQSEGGLGIGLSLVRELVEMHGGRVSAHSGGLGLGSEFVVRLPVSAPGPEQRRGEDGVGKTPTGRRILVVDDNRDAALSLAMLLSALGNETATAHDGLEAVELAGAFRPEVVLLDIRMPRLNGYDACRRIREQPEGRDLVLVAVTGWGQDEDRRRAREAGFDHHLVKPVDPHALFSILTDLPIRRPRSPGPA